MFKFLVLLEILKFSMNSLAPIALFVYNRPNHVEKVIKSLLKNEYAKDSELYIFSDGAKFPIEKKKVIETREYIQTIQGFKTVHINLQSKNLGLANSILQGVDKVLIKYDRVIVLEDDIVVNKYFLEFMNSALEIYKDSSKVASIHGYLYPISSKFLPDTFFLKGADCWGWGTWRRSWNLLERNGEILKEKLENNSLITKFNLDDSYPYFQMLCDQIEGKNNSWAIRWHASIFLKNMFTLYPKISLVQNIGMDSSGTHTSYDSRYDSMLSDFYPKVVKQEDKNIQENFIAIFRIRNFFKNQNKVSFKKNIKKWFTFLKYILIKILSIAKKEKNFWFSGNYPNFESAANNSTGYDSNEIFKKVAEASLAVKQGKAKFERDSVLFYKDDYSSPLSIFLFYIISRNNNILKLLDFGGSLGSTFYQYKPILNYLKELQWSVIEQKQFVEFGKKNLSNSQLNFFFSLKEYFQVNNANVILLSSVMPYLENWKSILNEILKYKIKFLIIDRTPFFLDEKMPTRITIEKVPVSIYDASYPAIFFNQTEFEQIILAKYKKIFEMDGKDQLELKDTKVKYKALLFELL
jgi:putative methyltransferase (TIGR04325 family)